MHFHKDRTLSAAVVPLLLFMCGWVFLWPASYLVGWWPAHDARLERILSQPGVPTPSDTLSKYAPHTAVKLTHLLPSGVWSLCGALQLLPRLRTTAPRLHRVSGRVMFLCSVLMVVGYALIEARGLVTHHPRSSPNTRAVDDQGSRDARSDHHWALRALCVWFTLTAGMALAQARRGNYGAHRRWALRHVASGAWVIVQRLFMGCVAVWASASSAAEVTFSEAQRRELFFQAASAAVVTCLGAAELYLWLGLPGGSAAVAAAAALPPSRHGPGGRTPQKVD